jgi:hypothetical protein
MDYAYISRRDKRFVTYKIKNEYIMPRKGLPSGCYLYRGQSLRGISHFTPNGLL